MSSSMWMLDHSVVHHMSPDSSCFASMSLLSSILVMTGDGTRLLPVMSSLMWILDCSTSHHTYPDSSCFASVSFVFIPVLTANGTLISLPGVVTPNLSLMFIIFRNSH